MKPADCLRKFVRDEEGQDLTEYGMVAFLTAIVAVLAVTSFGTELNRIWTAITSSLASVA